MPKIDATDLTPDQSYALMSSVIIPRPIAWVGSRSTDGVDNLAPYSFFGVMSPAPPVLHVSSVGNKDSLANIRDTGVFSVSVITADLLEKMNDTAIDAPNSVSEFDHFDIAITEAEKINTPMPTLAPIKMECELHSITSIGSANMIFGTVVQFHIADEIWGQDSVDVTKFETVARTARGYYLTGGTYIRMRRPTWQ